MEDAQASGSGCGADGGPSLRREIEAGEQFGRKLLNSLQVL